MTERQEEQITLSHDEEMAALLPFYLSNRLESDDQERVTVWLEENADAQNILAKIREEQDLLIHANEQIDISGGALSRLMDEIVQSGEIKKTSTEASSISQSIGDFFQTLFGARSHRLAWGLCVLFLALSSVQTALLLSRGNEGSYQTASGQKSETMIKSIALISFQPGATLDQVSKLLADTGVRIVSGPRGEAVYEIALDEKAHDKTPEELTKLKTEAIARLKTEKQIVQFITAK